jgi:prephenate dehydratase
MTTIVGVSGLRGSFSEEAGVQYAKKVNIDPSFTYLLDMEGVLSAIEKREIEFGILPVVNLQGGLVKPAFEAMGKHLFTVIDELWLEVNQCLLALPGTELAHITGIASHPQALAQCRAYITRMDTDAECIEWCDTAKAASDLADGGLSSTTAVIAPQRCASIYGLEILAKNIQDSHPNLTAFIIVKNAQTSFHNPWV